MRIFYCGDVVARAGRDVVYKNMQRLKDLYKIDCMLVNVENAAHGFGVTPGMCREFFARGADVLITGNHFLNQKEIIVYLDECKKIIRPANIASQNPGHGFVCHELGDGRKIVVVQVLGRVFMEPVDCPIKALEDICKQYVLGKNCSAIFVDIHAEATSEKLALAHCFDGKVSCVAGTHTHVPTSDAKILPNGTSYITDVGMCGDYNSVLGFEISAPVNRLKGIYTGDRLTPSSGAGTLYGILVETDDASGLAKSIQQIKAN